MMKKGSDHEQEPNISMDRFLQMAATPFIMLAGSDLTIAFTNEAFQKLTFGKDVVGQTIDKAIPEVHEQGIYPLLRKTFETGLPVKASKISFTRSNDPSNEEHKRYYDICHAPFKDVDGEVMGIIASWIEITGDDDSVSERREQLVNAQAYDLFMQTPVGFCLTAGANHTMELVNTEFLRLTGRTADVIGEPITAIFPEIAQQGYLELLNQAYSSGKPMKITEGKAIIKIEGERQTLYITTVLQPYFEAGNVAGILSILTDVTKEVEVRRQLTDSAERLRLAAIATSLGTWEFDMDVGHFILSDECKAMLGFTPPDFVDYSKFIERVHPEDQDYVNEVVTDAMQSGRKDNYDLEYRVLLPGITVPKWVRTQARVFANADNIPNRFIGTLLDITQDHNRVANLRIEEERLRLAAEAGKLGTFEFDFVNRHIVYSPRLGLIFGYKEDQVITHQDLTRNIHRSDLEIYYQAHRVAKKTGSLFYELRVVWADGSLHWVRVNGMVLLDKKGEPIRSYGTAAEITEAKEEEMILKESRQRFELIADAIPHMVWEIQLDGTISYINQQWIEWSGMKLEDVQSRGWSNIVHPDDLERITVGWFDAFAAKKVYTAECRVKNNVKGYTWFAVKIVPVKNEEGDLKLWIGTATNIHERKLMEQQKDEFISIASHELRTPVTTLKAYVHIAEQRLEKNGDIENLAVIRKMNNQVNRLSGLISDLLDISKIQQGKLQYDESFFNFDELVSEVVDDMQRTSATHVISTSLSADVAIYGDRNKFSQVIDNLISNAIKYSPEHERIVVITSLVGGGVRLSVEDFGVGVAPHERELIFKQFYRAQIGNQFTFPGMGIGLYISSEIVKRFDGKIWIDTEVTNGTIIHVELPLDHREFEEAEAV